MMTGSAGGGRAVAELMDGNMTESDGSEYRNRREPTSSALVRRENKALIQRRMHGLVLHATSNVIRGTFFADWFYDLRRGRLRMYGALLRFIDLSHARGVPEHMLQMIPQWIAEYIRDLYGDRRPPTPSATATVSPRKRAA